MQIFNQWISDAYSDFHMCRWLTNWGNTRVEESVIQDADSNFKMRTIGILALFLRPSQT